MSQESFADMLEEKLPSLSDIAVKNMGVEETQELHDDKLGEEMRPAYTRELGLH